MLMMPHLLSIQSTLWLFSLFSLANAQLLPHRNYIFDGDSRVIADIAIWCITVIANTAVSLLCFYPIFRLKEHRWTYICLLVSSLFTVVQASLEIGFLFFSHNGADIPNVNKIAGLVSATAFFGTWSSSFLYASLVVLLFDRSRQISRGAQSPIDLALFRCGFAYFGVIILVSTVYVGIYANSLALENKLSNIDETQAEAEAAVHAIIQAQNAAFAFSAFLFFSTIVITTLSISTFNQAKKYGNRDKITKNILLFAVPLYYAGMISGIVFTIFSSPTIVIINPIEIENIDLADDLLTQFLYTGVMIVILVLGFKPTNWRIKDTAVALSSLGALPSGGYFELDDPQK